MSRKNPTFIKMTADEWEAKYRPCLVHQNSQNGIAPAELAPWSGTMFETYGEDFEKVQQTLRTSPRRVWTLMDDGSTIISGFHIVNRLGYFITEIPFMEAPFGEVEHIEVTDE